MAVAAEMAATETAAAADLPVGGPEPPPDAAPAARSAGPVGCVVASL